MNSLRPKILHIQGLILIYMRWSKLWFTGKPIKPHL